MPSEAPAAAGRDPDFLGIGAQKAGTTWIHAQLLRHPELFLPAGKEIHFWNRNEGHGIDWYRQLFAPAVVSARAGEITPAYAFLPDETIERIRSLFPRLRLFYCLRNPVDRAWSSALMALERAEMTLGDASDQWFIDHFRSEGSRRRGDYVDAIERWRRHFGTDALLILWFDDIVASPLDVLRRLAEHLGVSAEPFERIDPASLTLPVNAGPGAALPHRLAQLLQEQYRPQLDALERLLGRDLSAWREPAR
jgi:hypothetical protein